MKNIKSKYWILCIILFIFNSCVEPDSYIYYYQLENKTEQDIEVRLYYNFDGDGSVNIMNIENGARGTRYSQWYDSESPFVLRFFSDITDSDSIVIRVQGAVVKKYDKSNDDVHSTRTPYNETLYVEEPNDVGTMTDVYTFLPEDLE